MSEWKEYRLGDLISKIVDNRGKTPPVATSGRELLEVNAIGNRNPDYSVVRKYVSEDTYNTWFRSGHPTVGDILIPTVGSVGIVSFVTENRGCIAQNLIALRFKEHISSIFIYYYLSSSVGKSNLLNLDIGGVQPSIKVPHLLDLGIPLPTFFEQERIAGILSSLDDKIDLLGRQNATLEAMAETLFRQYFIENSKKDWKETTLSSYVNCINGVSYTSDELRSSTTAMATLKSFHRDGGFKMNGYKEYTGKYKESQVIHEGDLLVAHTDITQDAAVIGNPVLVISNPKYHQLTFSMDLVKVEPIGYLSKELLYLLMRSSSFKEHCLGYANGSTVLHLSKKAIPEYEFYMPTSSIVDMLQKQVVPLVDRIFTNHKQIISLTTIRDTLLPKLMNNEIKI